MYIYIYLLYTTHMILPKHQARPVGCSIFRRQVWSPHGPDGSLELFDGLRFAGTLGLRMAEIGS